jgi:hypothetical protein
MLKVVFEDTEGVEHEAKVHRSIQVGDMVMTFSNPGVICRKIIKVELI